MKGKDKKKAVQQKRSSENLRQKWWNVLKNQTREFCLATGLHGYKYMAQSQRSKVERIVWAIILFTSLCCAIVLIKIAKDYYASHPTLTVIETTHRGIWNYPFPAVTICDINRVSLNLTKILVEKLNRPTNMSKEFLLQEFRLLIELLDPGAFGYDVSTNLTRLQNIIDRNGLSIRQVINMVTRNCNDLLESCRWNGEIFQCYKLFQRSLSADGICCSFNYLPSFNARLANTQPRRIPACGYQSGLTILINLNPADYLATIVGAYGVKVLLHDPYDYPDHNVVDTLIGLGKQVFISVAPEETYSTTDVRDLSVDTRNCIFYDESNVIKNLYIQKGELTLHKYSYANCMAQCRAMIIKNKCGCIPYYFPQNRTRVCNLKDVSCLTTYRSWYDTSWPGEIINEEMMQEGETIIPKRPCGCIPDCTFYRYPLEASEGILNPNVYIDGFTFTQKRENESISENRSIVHIFFSDLVAIQYRRNVYYNWRNLFASFGGLLGLFVGFSLMSAFELFYFFIVRVITDTFIKSEHMNQSIKT